MSFAVSGLSDSSTSSARTEIRRPPIGPPQSARSPQARAAPSRVMTDIAPLLEHWGYFAIFLIVVLGNVSVPVPEETALIVGGYLAWRGELQFPVVLAVGIVSAVVGDNVGYWIGRAYGRGLLDRLR